MTSPKTATSLISLEDAILRAVGELDPSENPDQGTSARLVDIFVSTGTIAGTQWRVTVEASGSA